MNTRRSINKARRIVRLSGSIRREPSTGGKAGTRFTAEGLKRETSNGLKGVSSILPRMPWIGISTPSATKSHLYLNPIIPTRSEEHTSELQSRGHLVCRLLLEKKKKNSK